VTVELVNSFLSPSRGLDGLGAGEVAVAELGEFGGQAIVVLAGESCGSDFCFQKDGCGEVGAAFGAVFFVQS
jgi:hypothetical protein